MAARKISPREERRARERTMVKLAGQSERLARLEPGGAPERPIDVESASQVEVHAASLPCPRCGGQSRVLEHLVTSAGRERVREVRLACPACGGHRSVYFRLSAARLH